MTNSKILHRVESQMLCYCGPVVLLLRSCSCALSSGHALVVVWSCPCLSSVFVVLLLWSSPVLVVLYVMLSCDLTLRVLMSCSCGLALVVLTCSCGFLLLSLLTHGHVVSWSCYCGLMVMVSWSHGYGVVVSFLCGYIQFFF